MLLEWENHTRSHCPNMSAELLEPGSSGACRGLVRAGGCAGSRRAEQRCPQPCPHLPREPPKASISHHLSLAS